MELIPRIALFPVLSKKGADQIFEPAAKALLQVNDPIAAPAPSI